MPALLGPDPSSVASPLSHAVVPQGVQVQQQKIPRSDRLEVSCCCAIYLHIFHYFPKNKKTKIY